MAEKAADKAKAKSTDKASAKAADKAATKAAEAADFSYNYEEEGKLLRKELKQEILTKGAWATVMFMYQELDRTKEVWGAAKVSIVRFKKSGGNYRKQSSFNISSEKQARQIVDVIERWYKEVGGDKPSGGADEDGD